MFISEHEFANGGFVMANEDKLKALDAAIAQIEKQYGSSPLERSTYGKIISRKADTDM